MSTTCFNVHFEYSHNCFLSDTRWKRRFGGGETPSQNMKLQIAAATWRIETRSDSAFYQITLALV